MKNKIHLYESDLSLMIKSVIKRINEGITFKPDSNGRINGVIDSRTSDADNYDFDTRIFGDKNTMLNGDGTIKGKKNSGFENMYLTKLSLVKTYESLIEYIRNGRNGKIYYDEYTPKKTITSISSLLKTENDEEIIRLASRNLDKQQNVSQIYTSTYDRIKNLKDGETDMRYLKGVVPKTNVTLISLFQFNNFNVSDFIKNGNFRQNDTTDKLLGIDSKNRKTIPKLYGKGKEQQEKIQATYDNGITPNLNNTFSVNNDFQYNNMVSDDHFGRKNYQYNDDNYTSVAKFTDKSILYAANVLKKENIIANYIVAAPSSSKFNDKYCSRLSLKTGIEYVPDFFRRNVINVVFNKEDMLKIGAKEESINDIENSIRTAVFSEISSSIATPIKQFFKKYQNYFTSIKSFKYDREKTNISIIESFVLTNAYDYLEKIVENITDVDDALTLTILNNLSFGRKTSKVDTSYLQTQVTNVIKKYLMKEFTLAIRKMTLALMFNHNKLISGYKLNFENKNFKITDFPDYARPYLKNCYVIADSELSTKQGKQLLSRYKNSKFIVFDEDIQSGGTLKLLIQCMKDKNIDTRNITCLVQAYGTS